MKILFVIPNIQIARYTLPAAFRNITPPESPHLGLGQLCEILRDEHNVRVIDMRLENKKTLLKQIKSFNPDIIGFTVISYCTNKVFGLIKEIKELKPNTPIVVGGPHVSCQQKNIIKECPSIDFAIIQEAEETFPELLENLKTPENVKGLIWQRDSAIIQNEPRKFIQDLDSLPFPKYKEFSLRRYLCWQNKSMPIITSRGCPFSCVYCSVFQGMGKKFRKRTAEHVLEEIKYWYDRGITKFNFNDDCFTLDAERVEKICNLIIDNGLKIKFRLYNGVRVDLLTKELVFKMKEAGCSEVSLGIETGNPETMKHIKKNIKFEQVFKAIEWFNEAGVHTVGNFIIGHPYETYQKGLDTIEMAKKINTNYVNFNNVIPYPGTELFDWIKKEGKFNIEPEEYLNSMSSKRMKTPLFHTKDFSTEERRALLKQGVHNFRKRYIESKTKKPLSDVLSYISRNDLLFGIMETAKNHKALQKVKRKIMKN